MTSEVLPELKSPTKGEKDVPDNFPEMRVKKKKKNPADQKSTLPSEKR